MLRSGRDSPCLSDVSVLTLPIEAMSYKPTKLYVKGAFLGFRRYVAGCAVISYGVDRRSFRTPTSTSLRWKE